MSDKPIIFSAPMVAALLDGRKTQTRRVLKPQPFGSRYYRGSVSLDRLSDEAARFGATAVSGDACLECIVPIPYAIGDRLWLRETWQEFFAHELPEGRPTPIAGRMGIPAKPDFKAVIAYRADGEMPAHPEHGKAMWRSSIHMPRWASRLTLTVTEVRVQRVQDISEADAMAEGCESEEFLDYDDWQRAVAPPGSKLHTIRDEFAKLWNSLNDARGFGWDANPWVVALTFTVERRNIDAEPKL